MRSSTKVREGLQDTASSVFVMGRLFSDLNTVGGT